MAVPSQVRSPRSTPPTPQRYVRVSGTPGVGANPPFPLDFAAGSRGRIFWRGALAHVLATLAAARRLTGGRSRGRMWRTRRARESRALAIHACTRGARASAEHVARYVGGARAMRAGGLKVEGRSAVGCARAPGRSTRATSRLSGGALARVCFARVQLARVALASRALACGIECGALARRMR